MTPADGAGRRHIYKAAYAYLVDAADSVCLARAALFQLQSLGDPNVPMMEKVEQAISCLRNLKEDVRIAQSVSHPPLSEHQ